MFKIEKLDFVVNFETDDIADVMIDSMFEEEREEYISRRKNGELTDEEIEAESLWDEDEKAYYDDDEKAYYDDDESLSDEDRVLDYLHAESLSIEALNGSIAVLENINKQLSIQFSENGKRYKATFLEFIGRDKFLEIVNMFTKPKQIIINNVSPQVGGVIDKNFGIKFNIELI